MDLAREQRAYERAHALTCSVSRGVAEKLPVAGRCPLPKAHAARAGHAELEDQVALAAFEPAAFDPREDEWQALPPEKVIGMMGLRHAFRTRPHFIAYWINELPAPAPWIARHVFGCALLTWTVRTPDQRARAARYADQMIFEGFVPGPKHP